ncbi:hypothetical protein ALC53_08200 [Atta colombica]|uniref:Uncharacterized protein n=1 Tax=Atta colombica TaxID=520822 RepID=A0A195BB22_9HYME|nr:hypothetical protein ALC53_08200 [Atta colombica]
MLESVYSHARSAFDPSAYAWNQKATSLTRVSVTHQPLKISRLAACLPNRRISKEREEPIARRTRSLSSESVSYSYRVGNSKTRSRVHLYTLVQRHASGKHLTKRNGIPHIVDKMNILNKIGHCTKIMAVTARIRCFFYERRPPLTLHFRPLFTPYSQTT